MDILKCVGKRIVFVVSRSADERVAPPLEKGVMYEGVVKNITASRYRTTILLNDVVFHIGGGDGYIGPIRIDLSSLSWWRER